MPVLAFEHFGLQGETRQPINDAETNSRHDSHNCTGIRSFMPVSIRSCFAWDWHMNIPFPSLVFAIVVSTIIAILSPSRAGSPYEGWRGQGSSSTVYHAGAPRGFGADRRPLDGSLRSVQSDIASPGRPGSGALWSGFTIGADVGAGFGAADISGLTHTDLELDGWLGGLHAGYQMQHGPVVAGIEVDGLWTNLDGAQLGPGPSGLSSDIAWLSSARARLGVAYDTLLVYATGGVALGGLDLSVADPSGLRMHSDTLVGYAAGGGIELRLSPNLSGRIEAIHYGFGETEISTPSGSVSADPDVTTIRAGLSYRLD